MAKIKKIETDEEINEMITLTPSQAADFLGYKLSTLYKKTSLGEIPVHKVNRKKVFFIRSELEHFLLSNSTKVKTNEELYAEACALYKPKKRPV